MLPMFPPLPICRVPALIVVPPLMGAIADHWGVSQSFIILGGFMLLLCIPLALTIRRVARRPLKDQPLADATD